MLELEACETFVLFSFVLLYLYDVLLAYDSTLSPFLVWMFMQWRTWDVCGGSPACRKWHFITVYIP